MMKKTQLLLLLTFVISGIILSPFPLKSEEVDNSFPVDDAGITAYAKINISGIEAITETLPSLDFVEGSGRTYALGTKEIAISVNMSGSGVKKRNTAVSFYIDTNGWMAAFLERGQETSKIMQWTDYEKGKIKDNILEEVLDSIAKDLGADLETPISYYHFGYPDANRIAMIVESVSHPAEKNNSFSMAVPGIIHEASYSFFYSFLSNSSGYNPCTSKLELDENLIDDYSHTSCLGSNLKYGNYGLNIMTPGAPHLIRISIDSYAGFSISTGASTVILYQV